MTNETFTATNGLTFTFPEDGSIRWEAGHPPRLVTEALREYFQHERDQELGRWRDTENPDHLVYPCDPYVQGYRRIAVVNERDMSSVHTFSEGAEEGSSDPKALTAQRYFSAHPEPKPWQEAKPGEVWLLKMDTEPAAFAVGVFDCDGTPYFSVPGAEDFSTKYWRITAGRRLWPEPEESDDA